MAPPQRPAINRRKASIPGNDDDAVEAETAFAPGALGKTDRFAGCRFFPDLLMPVGDIRKGDCIWVDITKNRLVLKAHSRPLLACVWLRLRSRRQPRCAW
jgi:hypothetical protein